MNTITKQKHIEGLDILRIFAIICVLACHTAFLDSSSGGIGNKIFFVLGGFLTFFSLTGNLCKKPLNIKNIVSYYIKRIFRILPSYWLVILLVYGLRPGVFSLRDFSTPNSLILNLLFVKTFGHLWFIQQMMLMYLLAPFIILIMQLP